MPANMRSSRTDAKPGLFAWLAYIFLIAGICFTIAGVKLGVGGLPYRALCFFAAMGTLALSDPNGLYADALRARKLLLCIGAFAILGSVVSLLAGTGMGNIAREVIEIHIQGAIIVTLSYALIRAMGMRRVLLALAVPILITGAIAVAQALGIGPAWDLRATLGEMMNDPSLTRQFYEKRERALGVSFSPVHVATQTSVAFAAFFSWRMYRNPDLMRKLDIPLMMAWMAGVLICISSGNRSPILGFAAFLLIYGMMAEPRRFLMALPLLLLVGLVGFEVMMMLGEGGARFAQTDDSSAAGRSTLAKFGWWLVLDRPFGWGFSFSSTDHWQGYAHDVIYDENPMSIRRWPPHNAYVLLLAKYGILVIPIILSVLPRTRLGLTAWFAFLPYGIHIYFHNDGPMMSDNLVWVAISMAIVVTSRLSARQQPAAETRRWTRAYRAQKATGLGQV